MNESRILASLENPFIVQLVGTYQTPNYLVYVSMNYSTVDLFSQIYSKNSYSNPANIYGKGNSYRYWLVRVELCGIVYI